MSQSPAFKRRTPALDPSGLLDEPRHPSGSGRLLGRLSVAVDEQFAVRAARAARCAVREYPPAAEALQRLTQLTASTHDQYLAASVDRFLSGLLAASGARDEWFIGDLMRVHPSVADDMLKCLDAKRRRAFGDTWLGMPPYRVDRAWLAGEVFRWRL